jgi:hypothetical protein
MPIYLALCLQMWGQDNSILKFIFGFVAAMCSPMIFCWYGTAIIENVSKNKFEELQKLQSFVSHFYYRYILVELTKNCSRVGSEFLKMVTKKDSSPV